MRRRHQGRVHVVVANAGTARRLLPYVRTHGSEDQCNILRRIIRRHGGTGNKRLKRPRRLWLKAIDGNMRAMLVTLSGPRRLRKVKVGGTRTSLTALTAIRIAGPAPAPDAGAEATTSSPEVTLTEALGMPIEKLDLTVRAYNCLGGAGIRTVGQLVLKSEKELLDIRNFGAGCLKDVKAKLDGFKGHKLRLGMSPADL
jgi:hypothetical protein